MKLISSSTLATAVVIGLTSTAHADVATGVLLPRKAAGGTIANLINLVPGSASMVIGINLEPSDRQQKMFALLAPVLDKAKTTINGLAGLPGLPVPGEMLKQIAADGFKGAVVFGNLGENGANLNPAALLSPEAGISILLPTSDGAKMEAAMMAADKKNDQLPKYWRGTKYHEMGPVKVMALPNVIVASTDEKVFSQVRAAAQGTGSFTQLEGFAAARARYASDANAFMMLKPHIAGGSWGGGALTIRDDGVSFVAGPFAPGILKGSALPVNYGERLPGGAYMVMGLAQPTELLKALSAGPGGGADLGMAKGLGELISLVKGDATLAVYPSETVNGVSHGMDALVEISDVHAADSLGSLFDSLKGAVSNALSGGKKASQSGSGSTTAGALAALTGLSGSLKDMAKGLQPGALRTMLAGKTLAWAWDKNTLILSSSDKLMAAAKTAIETHAGSLAEDPILGPALNEDAGETQMLMVADLGALADGITGLFGKKMDGIAQLLKMASAPVSIRMARVPGGEMAKIFLPVSSDMIKAFSTFESKK